MKSDRASLGLRGKSFGQNEGRVRELRVSESGDLAGQEEATITSESLHTQAALGQTSLELGHSQDKTKCFRG